MIYCTSATEYFIVWILKLTTFFLLVAQFVSDTINIEETFRGSVKSFLFHVQKIPNIWVFT